jgi:glucose-6-phosphate 1-epimerase
MDTESLNKKFAIGSELIFEQLASGITLIEIDTPLATATISLEGGQVVTWHPKSQAEPVLWVSKLAHFVPGKAIRGGVPICWPWFGAHPTNPKLPSHGYARITPWQVRVTEILSDGTLRICLTMGENELAKLHWPQQVVLTIEVIVGDTLTIKLTSTNESSQNITLTEGLHTYFNVGDVSTTRVHGFDGVEYVDLTRNNARHVQNGPITFEAELGRIFLNSQESCVIEDQAFRRRINVEKQGSLSTAVWNPWSETASTISDLGADGWRNMVCVEGANALDNTVTISPNASHTHVARYSAEALVPGR